MTLFPLGGGTDSLDGPGRAEGRDQTTAPSAVLRS